ncbi:hypothetical protein CI109_101524 [Kwoniella shandongensis]|uniref:Uncharacterized protein n=1 Tax=Kwoniella shandongensis TaxID=1734106 RepID=A0A5M6C766_9TREE|nr:uncharacterized protein CI109_001344 [Kwoniella shandongensis]KAA5530540.1 hypothetical protein CI109_001344 [Kwoniella shandongensis]
MKRSRQLIGRRGLASTISTRTRSDQACSSVIGSHSTTTARQSRSYSSDATYPKTLRAQLSQRADADEGVPGPGPSSSRFVIDIFNPTLQRAFHTSVRSAAQPLPDHNPNWDSWDDIDSSTFLTPPFGSPPPPPPPAARHNLQPWSTEDVAKNSTKGKERALPMNEGELLPQDQFDINDGAIDALYNSSSATAVAGEHDDIPIYIPELEEDLDSAYPLSTKPPPPLQEFPESSSSVSRSRPRQRRQLRPSINVLDLPELEADEYPPDGMTRFDWRDRTLSRQKKESKGWGRYWFPFLRSVWRREAGVSKLGMGDKWRDELDRYKRHFIPLLEAEQAEEDRLVKQRLTEWTSDRLHREGYMLDEVSASLPNQSKAAAEKGVVYQFARGKGFQNVMNTHRFTTGTSVLISRTHPDEDPVMANGTENIVFGSVWRAGKGYINILFPQAIDDIESGRWRLDIGYNDFAIRRQIEAIHNLNLDPFQLDMGDYHSLPDDKPQASVLQSLLSPSQPVEAKSPEPSRSDVEEEAMALSTVSSRRRKGKEQGILKGTALRDKLFRAFQVDYIPPDQALNSIHDVVNIPTNDHIVPEAHEMRPTDLDAVPEPSLPVDQTAAKGGVLARNQLIHSWTTRYRSARDPIKMEGDPEVPLNPTQLRAIAMMLSERLSLVQGPPGTGKTRVIIETIKLLKHHWEVPHPILVTAHTNVAVDNLLSGLRAYGVKALRMGTMERVPEDMHQWTMDKQLAQHPLYIQYEMLRAQREKLVELAKKNGDGRLKGEDAKKAAELGGRIWSMKETMTREILVDADVICTTCLSAASRQLQAIDFPIVFLDEASMATEPLSLVPLMKGSSHVAIIGDHKQLPPVIISPEAHAGGLATSLFERLIHERHIPSIMLDTQYRMHPLLSSFPSKTFYSGLLKDGTPAEARPAPETEYLLRDEKTGKRKNLTFLNHDHPESPMMKSISNHGDAEVVCDVIADLLYKNPDLKGSQIGIITPYLAQINLLSSHLSDTTRRQAFEDVLGYGRAQEVDQVEIKTVDGFEGREKEVVVFSTVRSNSGGWIGFLGDWRRVNVGLTRGRRALIMVGSKSTLGQARVGKLAADSLPQGGADVWRGFMKYLEEEDMIMDID